MSSMVGPLEGEAPATFKIVVGPPVGKPGYDGDVVLEVDSAMSLRELAKLIEAETGLPKHQLKIRVTSSTGVRVQPTACD